MNFCSQCGQPVVLRTPPHDDRPRFICDHCGIIHYQNPKIVVGAIPEWGQKVLLCRRAIEPRYGLWSLPAGYLENGETAAEGARREAYEETRITLGDLDPYALFNLAFVSQIYIMFRSPMIEPDFAPGPESLDVALFTEAAIPWDDLAFTVIEETLRCYFADRSRGRFGFHTGDIAPDK